MNGLPASLPVGQGRRESYLPEGKIYLSRTTGQGFFRALHWWNSGKKWRAREGETTSNAQLHCNVLWPKNMWNPGPCTDTCINTTDRTGKNCTPCCKPVKMELNCIYMYNICFAIKLPMKWKIICAYLKGLSKYRRMVFFFLKYLFPF